MQLKTLATLKVRRGMRVLVRSDLNASFTDGGIGSADLWKLKSSIATLDYLRKKGAAVIIIAHRGRPHGYDHNLSLAPIVARLSKLMQRPIPLWDDGLEEYGVRAQALAPGAVVCLENIRFFHEEEKNGDLFAKKLARLGDAYVNDAFGDIHREHASVVAITRHLPSYAGLLMERELKNLYGLLSRAKRPIVAIVGGNKISTKILLIKKLLRNVDWVLLGGALANTVLAAMDYKIGRSIMEEDMRTWSRSILHNKLKVPLDARVAPSPSSRKSRFAAIGAVRNTEMILDLGPDTIEFYATIIRRSSTVIWNGPVGYFEDARFAVGTNKLVEVIAGAPGTAYVGGGETVKAVLAQHAEKKIHFISTGGGAMLTLLEGRPLPALRALIKK